jgi:hypothetical protein
MFAASQVPLKDGRVAVIRRAVPVDARAITDFVNLVGAERRFVLRERATWTLEEEEKTLASADGRGSVFFVAHLTVDSAD